MAEFTIFARVRGERKWIRIAQSVYSTMGRAESAFCFVNGMLDEDDGIETRIARATPFSVKESAPLVKMIRRDLGLTADLQNISN